MVVVVVMVVVVIVAMVVVAVEVVVLVVVMLVLVSFLYCGCLLHYTYLGFSFINGSAQTLVYVVPERDQRHRILYIHTHIHIY